MQTNNVSQPMVKHFDGPIPRKRLGLNFSDKDCVAYYSIFIDGKKIGRWKSESYHAGYYLLLQASTYSDRYPDYDSRAGTISSVENTANGLHFHHTSLTDNTFKWLIFPNDPDWNMFVSIRFSGKFWDAGFVFDTTQYSVILPNLKNVDPLPDTTDAFIRGNSSRWDNIRMAHPRILPGQNTDPIVINEGNVHRPLIGNGTGANELSYGEGNVFPLNIQKDKGWFRINRSFDNVSGGVVDINDIHIELDNTGNHGYMPLFIRDVFASPLSVPDNSTITIEYELGVELENDTTDTDVGGTNGGFLESYIEAMRNFINSNARPPFYGVSTRTRSNEVDEFESNRGLIVGSNNTYVSCTDEFDPHGGQIFQWIKPTTISGPLKYTGTYVTGVDCNRQANEAWFDIGRVFINESSSDVVIKEVGLNGEYGLLARHALHQDDWITIAPGKAAQIEYRIKFTE